MPHHIKYPLARLSPAKEELLVFEFTLERIEAGDVAYMFEVLSPLAESAQGSEPEGRGSRCEIRRFAGARRAARVVVTVPGRTSRDGRGSWRSRWGQGWRR